MPLAYPNQGVPLGGNYATGVGLAGGLQDAATSIANALIMRSQREREQAAAAAKMAQDLQQEKFLRALAAKKLALSYGKEYRDAYLPEMEGVGAAAANAPTGRELAAGARTTPGGPSPLFPGSEGLARALSPLPGPAAGPGGEVPLAPATSARRETGAASKAAMLRQAAMQRFEDVAPAGGPLAEYGFTKEALAALVLGPQPPRETVHRRITDSTQRLGWDPARTAMIRLWGEQLRQEGRASLSAADAHATLDRSAATAWDQPDPAAVAAAHRKIDEVYRSARGNVLSLPDLLKVMGGDALQIGGEPGGGGSPERPSGGGARAFDTFRTAP